MKCYKTLGPSVFYNAREPHSQAWLPQVAQSQSTSIVCMLIWIQVTATDKHTAVHPNVKLLLY